MKIRSSLRCIALAALLAIPLAASQAADSKPLHVLFFNKSSGFEHSTIKLKPDGTTFAGGIMKELASKNNFDVTETKDGTIFTSADFKKFDVIIFVTTGNLVNDSNDGKVASEPPADPKAKPQRETNKGMGEAGKTALLDAIKNGKGFIALHCGSDTFHGGGPKKPNSEDNEKVDSYIAMLGGEFIVHGAQQPAKIVVTDPKFPGFKDAGESFSFPEEWYALKNFAPDLHVIAVQDCTGMKGHMYERPPFPETWARMEGKGRVFYSSMGHREDVWTNPIFQNALVGAINWTGKRVEADVTPNIDKVAPKAHEYPAPQPPAEKK